MPTRRNFIRAIAGGVAASTAAPAQAEGVLFEGYAVAPRKEVQEAVLAQPTDGIFWLLYGENRRMVRKESRDHGRTWGQPAVLEATDGNGIALNRNTAHHSLLRLRSGRLGLIYGGPQARPGRDGTVLYRSSDNGGKTWSPPVVVEPLFALCRSGSARVLRSGRIVAPTLKWISPAAGPESENEELQFVYSWINYSDDEGQTWRRSLSEVYISLGGGERGFYSFDEPVLEERQDGTLLMVARTQLGRPYQSVSRDGGVSWSNPTPVDVGSSPSPHTLARIPATGDLLLVWNQASTEECLNGLMRHRLSTAVSKDGGGTWAHFRNLESLDYRAHVEPPPLQPQVYLMRNWHYVEPSDRQRYPHAPGCLRVTYPTVTFWEREAAIAYDFGYGGPGELKEGSGTKIKVVTLDWLYSKSG
jgi:hypothetical protein